MSCRARLLTGLMFLSCVSPPVLSQGPAADTDLDRKIQQARQLQEQGRSDEARRMYAALLSTLRQRPASRQLGEVLDQVTRIETAGGNYPTAERTSQEAADVYHRLGYMDREAQAYNSKGIAKVQQGSYVSAEPDFQKALGLAQAAHATETETKVLNNLGSAFYFEGKYHEARRSYEQAMHLVDHSAASAWSAYWRQITAFNEATLYQRLGRYNNALEIYREIQASSKLLTAADRAHLLANLGAIYRRLGDPGKALQSYRSAQKLYATEHDADGEISVLKNAGIVYVLELGDFGKARKIFEQVGALARETNNRREQMQAHLYLGETLLRKASLRMAKKEFERAGILAKELGTREEQWKALYGLGRIKESSGDLSGAESDYRQAITTVESTRRSLQLSALRAEFLSDKRDVYDALIKLLVHKNDVAGAFSYLERSRARVFQDKISQAPASSPITLSQAQSRLPPGTLLLEYWLSGDSLAVIWCRKESYGMSAKELQPRERDMFLGLLDELSTGLKGGDWRDRITPLRALLPSGAGVWVGVQHVLIVPDGWLGLLPFDILPDLSNPKRVLIEERDISYLPSAALLLRAPPADGLFTFPWKQQLVAFGDPAFSRDEWRRGAGGVGQSGSRLLPASAEEVRSIARLCAGKTALFLGPADLKAPFLRSANTGLVLHVSTHALADDDDPENSRMLFSPEEPDGAADYVFLRELYGLDLRNVGLATISACDTERGKLIRGEGLQGFSRALLGAGARSSLTTLWRVEDAATAEFMKQFYYFALEQHRPRAEALRLAKLKFLSSPSHLENPQYWAAFVLNGDGLTPLPRVLSWAQLSTALAAITFVFIAAWLGLRSRRGLHRKDRAGSIVADKTENVYRSS